MQAELALDKDRPKELWIRSDGNVDNKETTTDADGVVTRLREMPASKVRTLITVWLLVCVDVTAARHIPITHISALILVLLLYSPPSP